MSTNSVRPSAFIQATDRQLQLVHSGNFADARRLDFEEVGQQFDLLQQQLQQASDGEARLAEDAATKSRFELMIAVALIAAFIVILFLRFQRLKQLVFAK